MDIASPQNSCGRCASASIDLALLTRVRFILSATPFCSGALVHDVSLLIQEIFRFCRRVSIISVCMKHLELLATVIFHKSFPLLKLVENLTLSLQNVHPCIACAIVDKGEEVFCSTQPGQVHFSTHHSAQYQVEHLNDSF